MTKKRLVLGMFLVLVMVSFISLQGFNKSQGNDEIRFTQDDSVRSMQVKLQQMRQEIAKDGGTFEIGMNEAMLTPLDQLCSFNPEMKPADSFLYESNEQDLVSDVMALPTSYYGIYTSVKNQGNCGSCWAFSMTATAETVALKGGGAYDFAEQYVLDCNTDGWSCSGGFFNFNMFMSPYGARLESCYPYTAVKGTCKTTCSSVYQITNWAYVGTSSSIPTSDAIKTAIYTYGAVSAAVYADSYLQSYSSGCFNRTTRRSCNHAIQLVGWNDTTPCSAGAWYLKNSWGTSWGLSGFMWIQYGANKVGYAACYAY